MADWTKQENDICLKYLTTWRMLIDHIQAAGLTGHSTGAIANHLDYLDQLCDGQIQAGAVKDQTLYDSFKR